LDGENKKRPKVIPKTSKVRPINLKKIATV